MRRQGSEKTQSMFAVGHLAMEYLIGKAYSETFGLKASVPLILLFSVLPDIDLPIPFVEHRGPTHSVIIVTLISSLFLLAYGTTVTPYLLVVAQHVLGDVPSGRTQLLWPLNQGWYGLKSCAASPFNITIEWILFLTSFILMLKTRDIHDFFKAPQAKLHPHHPSNRHKPAIVHRVPDRNPSKTHHPPCSLPSRVQLLSPERHQTLR